eukprot:362655-Chlamydomonas_euryale.AAC.3
MNPPPRTHARTHTRTPASHTTPQVARTVDAALRRSIPAFNADVKSVQRALEDIQLQNRCVVGQLGGQAFGRMGPRNAPRISSSIIGGGLGDGAVRPNDERCVVAWMSCRTPGFVTRSRGWRA